jgi:hypothetical protein
LVVSDARCHTAIQGMAVSDQDGYQSDHSLSFAFASQHLAKPAESQLHKLTAP